MKYRGIVIVLFEAPDIERKTFDPVSGRPESLYRVRAPAGRLIFNASSEFGESYALDPETALRDAKAMIDAGRA